MIADLSIIKLSAAMTRHASEVHQATAQNIARIDVPGAQSRTVAPFLDALDRIAKGETIAVEEGGGRIVLDREMTSMATNAGRQEAATLVWSKSLDLMRLAGAAPR